MTKWLCEHLLIYIYQYQLIYLIKLHIDLNMSIHCLYAPAYCLQLSYLFVGYDY